MIGDTVLHPRCFCGTGDTGIPSDLNSQTSAIFLTLHALANCPETSQGPWHRVWTAAAPTSFLP